MNIKFSVFLLVALMFLSMSEHAGKYPAHDFFNPVDRAIRLSGTFGELRTNHFHAGLDIKSSTGMSGDTIFAAQKGYVSRIRVDGSGYGNVLYIDHPNGYTTLYAHLDRFAPEIQEYIKHEQYTSENFEVDLYPDRTKFPVNASQFIGIMGNTGHSYGPHLHFEIRHTEGQVPVNPLHFGYEIADQRAPVIQQLIIYEYSESGRLNSSRVMQPSKLPSGKFGFTSPIALASSRVSFGVRAYDMHDGTPNQNGIYGIQCKADGEPSFAFTFDEIPIEQSRYLNAHIDYRQKINQNKFFHRCHALEGNKLPIYFAGVDQGLIYINPEHTRKITLDVTDFQGNISTVEFDVRRDLSIPVKESIIPAFDIMGQPDEVNIISKPGIQVVWPKGSFYEQIPLQIEVIPSEGLDCFSPHYSISPVDIPVHEYFDVNIEGLSVPTALANKVFIARCEADGSIVNCGATWIGNNLSTGVRQISTYTIMADTIPPKISTVHFGPKMTGWSRMAFKISDNFRVRERARELIYDAWIDGKWILMSMDGKTATISHVFDGTIPPGDHQLRLRVIDDRGNEAVLEKTFTL